MPVDLKEFLDGIAILADNHNMRATVRQSGKGALICGACCFVGGLVAGPVGLAAGGTIGGITAYRMTGNFRPVGEIIRRDLTMQQRERLTEHIVNSVREIHPTDLIVLLPIIMNSGSLQMAVLKTVTTFITNEMQMHIASS